MPGLTSISITVYVFAFAFGAAWGSFLNVVIYRLPRKLSLVKPGSYCPQCETPIKAYDNIPVLSWFILRGKCRACRSPYSFRYAGIELLMGLLSLALAWMIFPDQLPYVLDGSMNWIDLLTPYLFLFIYLAILVSLFFIDLDITELPPEMTIPGIGLGLLFAWIVPEFGPFAELAANLSLADSALGAVIGGGLILSIILLYFLIRGRVGMGGGDIWMMAMVGAFVGWQGLFFVFFASSVQGILVALGFTLFAPGDKALFRNEEVKEVEEEMGIEAADGEEAPEFSRLAVPFGPFIALSAVEYLFFGDLLLPLLTSGVLGPQGFLR